MSQPREARERVVVRKYKVKFVSILIEKMMMMMMMMMKKKKKRKRMNKRHI